MGQNPVLKIILLGDSGVGKSSLINRFVKNEFHERNTQTIGVDLSTKVVGEEDRVTLQIWDTGGQERFRSLRTPFYRGADCGILVYSKNDTKSRENIMYWRSEFYKHAPEEAPIIIARNKVDIGSEEGSKWRGSGDDIMHFDVSAKSALGVEHLFAAAARVGTPTATERLTDSLQNSSMSNLVSLQNQRLPRPKKCCS